MREITVKKKSKDHAKAWSLFFCITWLLVPFSSQAADMNVDGNLNVKSNAAVLGRVGIGTTNPVQKLDVRGAIRGNQPGGMIRIQTDHGNTDIGPKNPSFSHFYTDRGQYYFNREIRVDSGNIGSHDENLSLKTEGTTRMTISKSSGNVGIGNQVPVTKLHVNGDIYALGEGGEKEILVGDSPFENRIRMVWIDAADQGFIDTWDPQGGYHPIRIGGQPIVLSGGKVGIGTFTPSEMLDVQGSARVNGDAKVTGVLLLNPAGDLNMGPFTNGPSPSSP